jgi:propanediol utilization protein
MVTAVVDGIVSVVTVNVAEVAWAATVTLGGTVAAELTELDSVTTAPLGGALPVSVTVPVEGAPPVTLVGETVTVEIAAGLTVKMAVFGTLAYVAVIVGVAWADTPSVVIVKLAEVA